MAGWKRKASEEASVDFETMAAIVSDMLDTIQSEQIDFTRPFKITLNCALDSEGCVQIGEFGFAGENLKNEGKPEPLVEIIEFEKEVMAVVDATNLPDKDVDFKISENALAIFARRSTRQLKMVDFPCKVKEESMRTNYNNGVLEIRLSKKKDAEKKVVRAK